MSDNIYKGILPDPTEENGFSNLNGQEVTFLLGTDVHIGEPETCEQRVGITPEQAGLLKTWLESLGCTLNLLVVKDAGANAGFPDADYVAAGAQIVEESALSSLEKGPALVHALKESTHYEATIKGATEDGRFLRIGALHSGDFREDCGTAEVLAKRKATAIFDGSAVGGFAYAGDFEVKPKFRVPLRSSMSVYAGHLAGEDVGARLGASGERVVVSGGGVVGTSAVEVLLRDHRSQLDEILIIEKFPERCEELRELYKNDPEVRIKEGFDIQDADISGAKGCILTIFIQGSGATPKVVDLERISHMKDGGVVVDVAIDEGGGIRIDKEDQIDPVTGRNYVVTVEDIRNAVEGLGRGLEYHADNHMPRRRPREASIEHGKTGLMYLAVLLYLCAKLDGPEGAVRNVMDHDYIERPKTIMDALVLDLKHGLAFTHMDNVTCLYRHVLKKSDVIRNFLKDQGLNAAFV